MAEKRGLGRGLSALLGDVEETNLATGTGEAASVREIPIELIHANPDQPRTHFAAAEIDELADSIRGKGVLQPILVRPDPGAAGGFQIVAGERRWRASQKAGLRVMPALIRELDDRQVLEIAVIENVQRANLNPMEEAAAYQQLVDRFGHTQDEVAQSVGKSRSHVANTLRLMNLPASVRDLVLEGKLTAGHARAILTAEDPARLAQEIVARGLSVRDAEALVRKPSAGKARSRPTKDTDTLALESDLSDVLGLDVEVVDRGGVGELRIKYATLEQLDELCRRLTTRG
ncbi:ParB/RepB/Spo0J family partition protein [Phenylobacterium sp. LH3H17]|uniref:ParB/RepB/Spo0J family partition protein n=1 Tax=Phenylobacterium sp. LH3H17 TaxID=2903901 RepID=UPI0020C99137|nr:ParB/RepB/Spo0J family partition protein [Phenylobacterium sp. LH3H17]UTP39654.1 ParB/RepB/Spo0J family partition protein [Phenylobacterium sp. LH3H17]